MKKFAYLILSLAAVSIFACGRGGRIAQSDSSASAPAPWELLEEGEAPPSGAEPMPVFDTTSAAVDTSTPEEADETPFVEQTGIQNDSVRPAQLGRFRGMGKLATLFNDSNKYQYAAGERIGIKPIRNLADAYYLKRPLVKISSNEWYHLEELTHSMPYLVPEAAQLLETIGRNFADSLKRRNAEGHHFRVTSVLRTAQSVKRLRRVNRNATDSSTHQLGTTFDISYARFDYDGRKTRMSDEELKYILAEVLRDLRNQKKCMVKYEIKSPCFHITATGR